MLSSIRRKQKRKPKEIKIYESVMSKNNLNLQTLEIINFLRKLQIVSVVLVLVFVEESIIKLLEP